jgi:hypothetical protein
MRSEEPALSSDRIAHATLQPPEVSAIVPGHEVGMVHLNPRVSVSYASAFSDSARRSLRIVREHPHEPRPPRLLDRVRQALRARHYSRRTEESYVACSRTDTTSEPFRSYSATAR